MMTSAIPAPGSRRATDLVFRHLQRQIMLGEMTPGERIDMDAVAALLQVSRTPVREALLQLEREGLVDRQAYKGTVVAGVDPVRLEENTALRIHLEGLAASLGADLVTSADLTEMQDVLAELEAHTASEDYSLGLFNELNRRFHSVLYAASGREALIRMVEGLQMEADRIRLHFDIRNSSVNVEHRTILDACRARDSEAARRATQHHILNAYLRVRDADEVPDDAAMVRAVIAAAGLDPRRVTGARP